jgi:hypothetical protein
MDLRHAAYIEWVETVEITIVDESAGPQGFADGGNLAARRKPASSRWLRRAVRVLV